MYMCPIAKTSTAESDSSGAYQGDGTGTTSVGVIGCGPGGMAAVKELKAAGFGVTAFDSQSELGGVFAWAWPGLKMTSSSPHTAFSDFPPKAGEEAKIWTRVEYLEYLNAYVDEFGLRQHMHMNTRVVKARRLRKSRGGSDSWTWHVETTGPSGPAEWEFDSLVIATGTNNKPFQPTYPGQETYTGQILHSRDYKTAACFDGKRVVLQGMGESGSDISHEVAKVAESTYLSIRNTAGWVVPRHVTNVPADLYTNRVLWGLPRSVGGLFSLYMAVKDSLLEPDEAIQAMGKYNFRVQEKGSNGLGAFGTFGTKNHSFLMAIVEHGAQICQDIASLGPGKRISFTDGSYVEADALIQNTGFRYNFEILRSDDDEFLGRILDDAKDVKNLWKNCIHPDMGNKLCFLGYARPAFGSQPPVSEMQARLFTEILKGNVSLADKDTLKLQIANDQMLWRWQYGKQQSVSALVDYVRYMNDLASIIGCHPGSLSEYVWSGETCLAWCLLVGPHTGAQFRLKGPGAQPGLSRQTIQRFTLPLTNFLKSKTFAVAAALQMGCLMLSYLPLPNAKSLQPVGWQVQMPESLKGSQECNSTGSCSSNKLAAQHIICK